MCDCVVTIVLMLLIIVCMCAEQFVRSRMHLMSYITSFSWHMNISFYTPSIIIYILILYKIDRYIYIYISQKEFVICT